MSIAASPDRFEYEEGRTAARRTLAHDIAMCGIDGAVMRASSWIDTVMSCTGGNVDDSVAGSLFEFNRFLDRHSCNPAICLDVVDRDAAPIALPVVDAHTAIELCGVLRRRSPKKSPKDREGA